jgi:hypothetical protein
MNLRALAFGTALLAATVPSLSSSAEAAPWGWRGGWGGWHGGGWGWGGVGLGLAAGAIVGSALAAPYGYYNAGYPSGYYGDYYSYGYVPVPYAYVPAVTYANRYGYPGYGYGYRPSYGYGYRYGGY